MRVLYENEIWVLKENVSKTLFELVQINNPTMIVKIVQEIKLEKIAGAEVILTTKTEFVEISKLKLCKTGWKIGY